jgi:hypothetical protein
MTNGEQKPVPLLNLIADKGTRELTYHMVA